MNNLTTINIFLLIILFFSCSKEKPPENPKKWNYIIVNDDTEVTMLDVNDSIYTIDPNNPENTLIDINNDGFPDLEFISNYILSWGEFNI